MRIKTPFILATAGALALAGCADTYGMQGDPHGNAKGGAITGALLGGVIGAASGGKSFQKGLIGAAVGGTVGAIAGSSLDQQASDLRGTLGNDNITVTNTGSELVVSMPQDILFATDSTAVRPDLQRNLAAVAQNLQHYPNSQVVVIGHTDNTGSAAHNLDLSQGRAAAVVNILIDAGVPGYRLRAVGRGEDEPVATNLTAEGRAQNRRVEIHIQPTR